MQGSLVCAAGTSTMQVEKWSFYSSLHICGMLFIVYLSNSNWSTGQFLGINDPLGGGHYLQTLTRQLSFSRKISEELFVLCSLSPYILKILNIPLMQSHWTIPNPKRVNSFLRVIGEEGYKNYLLKIFLSSCYYRTEKCRRNVPQDLLWQPRQ